MLDFLYQRLDFIFFVYATLFLLTSKKAFINSRLERKNDLWFFISVFLLACGARYIVDAISLMWVQYWVCFRCPICRCLFGPDRISSFQHQVLLRPQIFKTHHTMARVSISAAAYLCWGETYGHHYQATFPHRRPWDQYKNISDGENRWFRRDF